MHAVVVKVSVEDGPVATKFLQIKRLINPGAPAAHPEPAYRCFLPDLTGFTGPWLRRTRAHEREKVIYWKL